MRLPVADPDRQRGALLGLAAGDAVGTTVEFQPPGSFEPVVDMVGGGPFGLPVGAWTDDTSMALCLAESLVERGGFDPAHQAARYVRWRDQGHLSSTGRCFDIGNTVADALTRFAETGEPYSGSTHPRSAGNGSLMRLAPVPIAWAATPWRAVALAGQSSRTTHGTREAVDACRYFAALLVGAFRGAGKAELLDEGPFEPAPGMWSAAPLAPAIAEIAAGSFRRRQPPRIRGTGYVVRSLEAALWAVHGASTFRQAVLRAANLGDDADTTAAIAGQLAGAWHGASAIPAGWRQRLALKPTLDQLADDLVALSRRLRPPRSEPPVPDSWWVLPGRLLAGEYPGARDASTAARRIASFVEAGVTTFLDLTEEDEGLQPYAPLLPERSPAAGLPLQHHRMPIPDGGRPTDEHMRAILDRLEDALRAGHTVYLHCWGGHGRTGTVAGCILAGRGRSGAEALAELQRCRAAIPDPDQPSPETEPQRAMVRGWAEGS